MAAALIARLAARVLDLDRRLAELDELIAARVHAHWHAAVITSMVGIGDLLGAEFLAATGVDLSGSASADHLAGYAGLGPAPRDFGRRRQPAPPEAVQPPTAARLLHLGADQHPMLSGLQGLLRPQASRRQTPHPGRARPGPAARERALGHAPRQPDLSGTTLLAAPIAA
jgi:hypothetical protein